LKERRIAMGKRFILTMVLGLLLACAGFVGQVSASETVASIDWQISHVTNLQNEEVGYSRPILSLDVDLGWYYLNLYGTLCSEDGIDCLGVNGVGYFYYTASGMKVKMDVRAGTEMFRIELDPGTLGGMVGIYDKDGQLEAVGSIDLGEIY
jgi:hypothetical protein